MESISSEDEESPRDNNVDLNEENIEQHMTLEVNNHLVEADTLFSSDQLNSENAEPFVGMEFESEESAKLFYMAYASRMGFSVRISKSRRSRNDESIIMRRFVCSKEGFHLKKENYDDSKKKRKRATIREGCNAMIEVIQKYYGRWVVTKLVKDHNHIVAAPSRVLYIAPEEYAHVEPYLGMEFQSHEAAQTYYYAYASRVGFDVRIRLSRRSTRDESFVMRRFVCTKEGYTPYEDNNDENKKKRSRTPIREGCKAMFEVIKKDFDKWVVNKLVTEHTHELAVATSKVHYIQSQSEVVVLAKSGTVNREKSAGTANSRPQLADSFGSCNGVPLDDQNAGSNTGVLKKHVFGVEDTQNLLDHLKRVHVENPTFFYAFQVDKDNCLTHVFWTDARAKTAYYCFGDAVTFNSSYMENKNMLPFVTFTGVNNHLQSVIFGSALLTDSSEASFIWLFQNWLVAMSERPPPSLTTDLNETIGAAVLKVFPLTDHRFCRWYIMNKCKEKLFNLYLACASFERELEKCINESETGEAFESCWKLIMDKYNLGENTWLQYLYNIRQKWVPVYLKHMFTAEISTTQRPESLNKYFDKYFNTKTSLYVFVSLFEQVMLGWYEREYLEDISTANSSPVLRIPSSMLKQAADLYTRSVFDVFEDEFIECLGYYADKIEDGVASNYIVAKDEGACIACSVTFNSSEKTTSCSCRKFETTGILCRHILRVFLTVDIRAIPEYYMWKRWTKSAKNGFVYDECVRYNELCRDAIKYAMEGSTSAESYSVAKQALHIAYSEVVAAKKNVDNQSPI